MSHWRLRPARPEDAPALVPLIDAAGSGLPLAAWRSEAAEGESASARGAAAIASPTAWLSHRCMTLAVDAPGDLLGVLGLRRLVPRQRALADKGDIWAPLVPLLELERIAGAAHIVNALAVVPEARRRGLGRALLEAALSKTRSEGGRDLVLIAASDNPALSLYRKMGFQQRAQRPAAALSGFQYPGADWLLMARRA